jgi:hypothetical protein
VARGEQALGDAGHNSRQGARPVTLERELLLERLEDRFDPLAHAAERAKARRLVVAVRAHQAAAVVGDELLELAPGKALVGAHDPAVDRDPLEDLGRRLALGDVGRRELEANRHPVRGAEQGQAKAPEKARVRAAIAVGGVAGEGRAAGGLARLAAGQGRRVEQPELIAERARREGQRVDRSEDLGRERPDALVVAGLLGRLGKQLAQAPTGEGEEAAVVAAVEENLGDGQGDELGIGELGRAAGTNSLGQQIVQPDLKCGDEGVEVGAHAASLVDVVVATSNFGALTSASSPVGASPRRPRPRNSESTI